SAPLRLRWTARNRHVGETAAAGAGRPARLGPGRRQAVSGRRLVFCGATAALRRFRQGKCEAYMVAPLGSKGSGPMHAAAVLTNVAIILIAAAVWDDLRR